MTQLIRNAYLAGLLVLAPVFAYAQLPGGPTEAPPSVSTSGEGMIEAVPDRAWITVSAESRAGNPRAAQQRNTEIMAPVIDKLRGAGIPADAIRTVGYDLQQEWDYVNNRRVSRGYVARNTINVRVDDIDRVGELLELAVGSGATSVGAIRFDLKDRARIEREALRLAVADARARAEAAAEAAGMTIDRVLRIEVHQAGGGPVPLPRMAMREAALAADAPPIQVGTMEIRAQVTLTAAMQ